MGVKIQLFNLIQGMNQDISPSKRTDKLAYEIKNMRITVEDDNTLMSWENEKGTKELVVYDLIRYENTSTLIPIKIKGVILGTCVLKDYLILFIKINDSVDKIAGINFKNKYPLFYTFYEGNLNFQYNSTFESLGIYENESILKIYWIDGINQTRFINIAGDLQKIKEGTNTLFDFLPTDTSNLLVSIEKEYQTGLFKAGTILYAFNYFNLYGAQTNLVYISPILYISYPIRGGEADDSINCAFKIICSNLNLSFDFIRIYSISRTSTDTTPQVRIVRDLPLSESENNIISFIDNGLEGTAIDYNELLFMNNLALIPTTMDLKDNTLFLGDLSYSLLQDVELKELFIDLKSEDIIQFSLTELDTVKGNLYYPYFNQLLFSSDSILGFKGGETYVFGFILLDTLNRWTSIIPLQGAVVNTLYPKTDYNSLTSRYTNYIVQASISKSAIDIIKNRANSLNSSVQYKNIKFVIVSSTEASRSVLCLGIINPTVFCTENRYNKNLPYAQSSWFFRPLMKHDPFYYKELGYVASPRDNKGSILEFRHYASLSYDDYTKEIQSGYDTQGNYSAGYRGSLPDLTFNETDNSAITSTCIYGVDLQILTMHSPDIEFNSVVLRILQNNSTYKFRIIGYTKLHNTYSDSNITLGESTYLISSNDSPIITRMNCQTGKKQNSLLINPATCLNYWYGAYGSTTYKKNNVLDNKGLEQLFHTSGNDQDPDSAFYKIYPWNRNSSINILPTPSTGSETNTTGLPKDWMFPITTKIMSNYRICGKTVMGNDHVWRAILPGASSLERGCSSIAIWTPLSKLEKIIETNTLEEGITYQGNIDTVVSPAKSGYTIYGYKSNGEFEHVLGETSLYLFTDGVNEFIRMKYNSTEHAVFSLGTNIYSKQNIKFKLSWILPFILGKSDNIPGYRIPDTTTTGLPIWETDVQTELTPHSNTSILKNIIVLDTAQYPSYNSTDWIISDFKNIDNLKKVVNQSKDLGIISNINTDFILMILYNTRNSQGYDWCWFYTIKHVASTNAYMAHFIPEGTIIQDSINNKYYKITSTSFATSDYSVRNNKIVELIGMTVDEDSSIEDSNIEQIETILGTKQYTSTNYKIDDEDDGIFLIGEFYLESLLDTQDYNLLQYNWQSASDSIPLNAPSSIKLYGDTYYQRYDCLKTYPMTDMDPNQIVDIASFMVESRVNIDGRWDRNRGSLSALNITNTNFNLVNPAYTLYDKFVLNYISDAQNNVINFPNTITWTLTKVFGELVDSWTKLTSTSILDLDGDKGKLRKILNFRNTLVFFQDTGMGYIKYNENIALQTNGGLPVELSNSGKVEGKLYLNNIIGCLNKDTIVVSKNAVYFIDGNTQTIYQVLEPQGLVLPNALSDNAFDTYLLKLNLNNAKSIYNKNKQEIYFIFYDNHSKPCLTYNELAQTFTSFYDYKPDFMHNINNFTYHILNELNLNTQEFTASIWTLNEGLYNYFYQHNLSYNKVNKDSKYSPFYITLVGNGEGSEAVVDKIWDNLEFRSDSWSNTGALLNTTFDNLSVWNEYLVGNSILTRFGEFNTTINRNKSINIPSTLKKKFRIWRANFPRSKYFTLDVTLNVEEKSVNDIPDINKEKNINYDDFKISRDRIRNPWTYFKLSMMTPNINRTVLHDALVYYYL